MARLINGESKTRLFWTLVNGVPTRISDNERNKRIDALAGEYESTLQRNEREV